MLEQPWHLRSNYTSANLKDEMIRFDEEVAFVGIDHRWCHRVVNEMIRFRTHVEGIVNLLSGRWTEGDTVDETGLLSRSQLPGA